mmetsp:Transcript_12420/g.27034  ORF Transcript_12420/g.27034 Transcript_12420/m.27034 type:complete len:220 (-) Transcript_12420:73-732(-)
MFRRNFSLAVYDSVHEIPDETDFEVFLLEVDFQGAFLLGIVLPDAPVKSHVDFVGLLHDLFVFALVVEPGDLPLAGLDDLLLLLVDATREQNLDDLVVLLLLLVGVLDLTLGLEELDFLDNLEFLVALLHGDEVDLVAESVGVEVKLLHYLVHALVEGGVGLTDLGGHLLGVVGRVEHVEFELHLPDVVQDLFVFDELQGLLLGVERLNPAFGLLVLVA